jgi:hypothetical protein
MGNVKGLIHFEGYLIRIDFKPLFGESVTNVLQGKIKKGFKLMNPFILLALPAGLEPATL